MIPKLVSQNLVALDHSFIYPSDLRTSMILRVKLRSKAFRSLIVGRSWSLDCKSWTSLEASLPLSLSRARALSLYLSSSFSYGMNPLGLQTMNLSKLFQRMIDISIGLVWHNLSLNRETQQQFWPRLWHFFNFHKRAHLRFTRAPNW